MRNGWKTRGSAALGALILAVTLGACAQSERDAAGQGSASDTFVFAASSDPVMLDPALASDGESFRVARQIFEGLVSVKPGTVELTPLLATEWDSSQDGKTHTFTLRENVKFHDGTDFNAAAVCANFDRWYNWTGLNQNENISYYYGKLFRGFKTPEGSDKSATGIYKSCETNGNKVTINLNTPFAAFVDAMTLPSFAMQSPAAMREYDADNTGGTVDDPRFSVYATERPTGTGPFTFESWERGQQVTLKANPNYWGEQAKVKTAIVRTIADGNARKQELQAGNIDGYDLVAAGDVEPMTADGLQIINRPAFNILYLGFNQANPALKDERVRRALNYAIDKQAVIDQSLPPGSIPATQYMPQMVNGYNPNATTYEYDPEKAKKLLAEAGQSNLKLKFAYPTGVSRPYMPTPEDTYVALKTQFEAVGITVEPVTAQWTQYLDLVRTKESAGDRDVHLLGWTGDYNDPDNFLGVFFGAKGYEWGFDNLSLFKELGSARELPDKGKQKAAYSKINDDIGKFAPGVPIAHPAPSLAFRAGVQGYPASPVQDEVWNTVTVTR